MTGLRVALFFCWFNILTFFSVFGQAGTTLLKDSSRVNLRHFDSPALKNYRLSKDFQYGAIQPDISPGLWDKFWDWFWSLFRGALSTSTPGTLLQYFLFILGIAALIFLIIKLSGMDLSHLFTGKSKEIEISYDEKLENIHQISFDEEIEKAMINNDLRLAVRLLYLKTLKILNSRGKIKWELDKTNTSYISELQHPAHKEKFRLLTHRFEYVWYGSFNISNSLYEKISRSFHEFNSMV
ncbi:MAG: hypothetical protein H7Y13_17345 [Sphingobacteriaceae bacterium]|nr:hypothetical protein [Sphingobacteriaceae bacterium]